MYSLTDRKKAVELYIKSNFSEREVVRQLGYPSPNALRRWYKEYLTTGALHEKSLEKPRYTIEQKNRAVSYYAEHSTSFTQTCRALGYPTRSVLRAWIAEMRPELLNRKCTPCKSTRPMIRYSPEEKQAIVEELMVTKTPIYQVAAKCNISRATLSNWKRQMLGKDSLPPMESTEKALSLSQSKEELEDEVARLKSEIYLLQMERDALLKASEILKKAEGINLKALRNREKAEVIDALREKYRLNDLLQLFQISKSSYCYQRNALRREDKYVSLRLKIREIFETINGRYGYRRIYQMLKRTGTTISEKVVRRLMAEEGLAVRQQKRKKYSSYMGEISPAVPNVIHRDFHAETPNSKWLTDITEFAIPAGKVYLSPIIDCFDGLVVSWTVRESPSANLVNDMLDAAIASLKPGETPIIHSDRGVHYRWPGWIERMEQAGLTRSMSKKGCSPDNSACEGFFGRMKNEMFYGKNWMGVTVDEFIQEVNAYVLWYNAERIKGSLGWLSPLEYRRSLGLVA
jgi:transposase InsO family protein/transposase-like protein